MRASAIRNLSTSRFSHLLAAGFWEKTIQIWNLDQRDQIAQIETRMVDSQNKLYLDPKGERGVVAAWRSGARGGVACYEISSGNIVWHRTDLRHTQGLSYSPDGQSVWFEPNEGRSQRLDAITGATVETMTGVKHLHLSDYSAIMLIEKRSGSYVLRGEEDFAIPKLAFAVLDVAFSPESLCLTEAGGPVRCLHCHNGAEMWRYEPGAKTHVLRLWYRESDKNYYGVEWQYDPGGPHKLLRFEGASGRVTEICQLDSWEEAVGHALDCVVLSSGKILSLPNGKFFGSTGFPPARLSRQKIVTICRLQVQAWDCSSP